MLRTTSFPINFQEESLYKLWRSGGKFFFRIDLSQAYYSIPSDEPEHRDKTAFYTLGQQLRFKVSPYRAKYLPSQFNHLMAKVLGDIDDNLFFYSTTLSDPTRQRMKCYELLQMFFSIYGKLTYELTSKNQISLSPT